MRSAAVLEGLISAQGHRPRPLVAQEPVEGRLIPSRRLRDLLVEEAELCERIMPALILRRIGLIETGAGGPVTGLPSVK